MIRMGIQHDCIRKFMKSHGLPADHFAPKGEMGRFYTVINGIHLFLDCSRSKCQWVSKYSGAYVQRVFTAFYAEHEPEKSKNEVRVPA